MSANGDHGRLIADRYRLGDRLGEGAAADVYVADDSELGNAVVVKVLHTRRSADPVAAKRFEREARVAHELRSHPNIVGVLEWGYDDDDRPFMVMEYAHGISARELLDRDGPMPAEKAALLVADVASGIHAAHERGVIHRDIKPANIVVTEDSRAQVIDFGLAHDNYDNSQLTSVRDFLGSAAYAAPEEYEPGWNPTEASDIYAMGATLNQLLTGVPPFVGESVKDTMLQKQRKKPRRLSQQGDCRPVPHDLEAVVLKALAKNPKKRYTSARAMQIDLGRFLAGSETRAAAGRSIPGRIVQAVRDFVRTRDPDRIALRRLIRALPLVAVPLAVLMPLGHWEAGFLGASCALVIALADFRGSRSRVLVSASLMGVGSVCMTLSPVLRPPHVMSDRIFVFVVLVLLAFVYLGGLDRRWVRFPLLLAYVNAVAVAAVLMTDSEGPWLIGAAIFGSLLAIVILYMWPISHQATGAGGGPLGHMPTAEILRASYLTGHAELVPALHWGDTPPDDALTDDRLLWIASAFMNSEGGTIIIGASETGEIGGIDLDREGRYQADAFLQWLRALLDSGLPGASRYYRIGLEAIGDACVCRLDLGASGDPAVATTPEGQVFCIRHNDEVVRLETREALAYQRERWD